MPEEALGSWAQPSELLPARPEEVLLPGRDNERRGPFSGAYYYLAMQSNHTPLYKLLIILAGLSRQASCPKSPPILYGPVFHSDILM